MCNIRIRHARQGGSSILISWIISRKQLNKLKPGQEVLVTLFCHIKCCGLLHVHVFYFLAKLLRNFSLTLVQVEDGSTILCLGRVRMTRRFPLAKNLFVAYCRRIKLHENRFRKVFHLGIRWIGLMAARITNYAPLDAMHSLKFGLRPPKSSAGDNGNLVARSRSQGDFWTHGAHAQFRPTRCRMSWL
jgi:hypothetical protein